MIKKIIITTLFFSISLVLRAQVGVTFGAYFPTKGTYTGVVAPLSIRDVGVSFGKYLSLSTGYTMMHFSSAGITNLPFDLDNGAISRNFANFIPLDLGILIPIKNHEIMVYSGFFWAFSFANRIDHGVFDRNYGDYLGYELLQARSNIKNKFTRGHLFGLEFNYHINDKLSFLIGSEYLVGGTRMDIKGNYRAYDEIGDEIVANEYSFKDAKIDFTGFDFFMGVKIKTK